MEVTKRIMVREELFVKIEDKEEAVAQEQQKIKDEEEEIVEEEVLEEEVVEEEVAEEEVVEEEVVEEKVVKDLIKGMQLLLSIKVLEEKVVEEEYVEELLKFTRKEGVMMEIPKALVHQW
jgi:hypothetical protein